jgi:hypothetical protein
MKKIVIGALLLLAAHAWAASEPNPADYTTKVHVSASRIVVEVLNGLALDYQVLSVVIGAKKYELKAGPIKNGLLILGDYNAKLVQDEHKTAYDSQQEYEFLFNDNKVRKFEVVGQIE